MRCSCVFYLTITCTMMILTTCVSKPTVQPNDADSYDGLNITCVSTRYNINSSSGNDQPLVKLDNIEMENTSAINVTENENMVLNDTKQEIKNQGEQTPQSSEIYTPAKKELPMGMIIAGPAAAMGIVIFLCFSYYCHTMQLNNQAKRLSMALYVTPDDSTDSTNEALAVPIIQGPPPPPRIHKQSTASLTVPPRLSRENSDLYSSRRKSTLTVPSLSVPGNLNHKRGSSWSALADQEILNLTAPRRHSTFIL